MLLRWKHVCTTPEIRLKSDLCRQKIAAQKQIDLTILSDLLLSDDVSSVPLFGKKKWLSMTVLYQKVAAYILCGVSVL